GGAEGEDAREEPFLVHAEGRRHVAVLRRRAYQHAPARAVEKEPQKPEHERPENDQEEIVGRQRLSEDVDGTAQARRTRTDKVLRSPDDDDEVLEDEGDAKGGEKLEQLGRA